MGETVEIIRAAITAYQRTERATPASVAVSAIEDMPPFISGVPTRPSIDLNPGSYLLHTHRPNHQPYWTAALARHKALIAAGCISPVGEVKVGKGKQERDGDDTPSDGFRLFGLVG